MIKVKVLYCDGREIEASVGPRVRVEVERKFDAPFWELIGESATRPREDVVYFMSYSAARLAGQESTEDYDEWLALIDDVDIWSAKDKTNPTRRAPKPAKSSNSASPPEFPSAS